MGADGKMRFTTVTEAYGFAARCGSGAEGGRRVVRAGSGSVDTTCVGASDWPDVVVSWRGKINLGSRGVSYMRVP